MGPLLPSSPLCTQPPLSSGRIRLYNTPHPLTSLYRASPSVPSNATTSLGYPVFVVTTSHSLSIATLRPPYAASCCTSRPDPASPTMALLALTPPLLSLSSGDLSPFAPPPHLTGVCPLVVFVPRPLTLRYRYLTTPFMSLPSDRPRPLRYPPKNSPLVLRLSPLYFGWRLCLRKPLLRLLSSRSVASPPPYISPHHFCCRYCFRFHFPLTTFLGCRPLSTLCSRGSLSLLPLSSLTSLARPNPPPPASPLPLAIPIAYAVPSSILAGASPLLPLFLCLPPLLLHFSSPPLSPLPTTPLSFFRYRLSSPPLLLTLLLTPPPRARPPLKIHSPPLFFPSPSPSSADAIASPFTLLPRSRPPPLKFLLPSLFYRFASLLT